MPPIKIVTDSFSLIGVGISITLVVLVGVILRSAVFSAMKVSQEAMSAAYDSLRKASDELKLDIVRVKEKSDKDYADLKEQSTREVCCLKEQGYARDKSFHLQESRLFRVEIDGKKKAMRVGYAMEEIRILELVVNICVSSLSRIEDGGVTQDRVLGLLAGLTELRRKNEDELSLWEATQLSMVAYLHKNGDAAGLSDSITLSTSDTTTTTNNRTTVAQASSISTGREGERESA